MPRFFAKTAQVPPLPRLPRHDDVSGTVSRIDHGAFASRVQAVLLPPCYYFGGRGVLQVVQIDLNDALRRLNDPLVVMRSDSHIDNMVHEQVGSVVRGPLDRPLEAFVLVVVDDELHLMPCFAALHTTLADNGVVVVGPLIL